MELDLGEHNYEAQEGYVIVGWEVWMTTWAGKPSRSGWDTPIKNEVIDRFVNCQDVDNKEMELRKRGTKNVSFYVFPLQIKQKIKERKQVTNGK